VWRSASCCPSPSPLKIRESEGSGPSRGTKSARYHRVPVHFSRLPSPGGVCNKSSSVKTCSCTALWILISLPPEAVCLFECVCVCVYASSCLCVGVGLGVGCTREGVCVYDWGLGVGASAPACLFVCCVSGRPCACIYLRLSYMFRFVSQSICFREGEGGGGQWSCGVSFCPSNANPAAHKS
jgi:hypothetical protein